MANGCVAVVCLATLANFLPCSYGPVTPPLLSTPDEILDRLRLGGFVHYHEIPTKKSNEGSLEERSLVFEKRLFLLWAAHPVRFSDCTQETRSDPYAIRALTEWRPRELKNSDPIWLNNKESVSNYFRDFYQFIIRTSKAHFKLHLKWAKFLFDPSDTDTWFWNFHYNLYPSGERPKTLSNAEFTDEVNSTERLVVLKYLESYPEASNFFKSFPDNKDNRQQTTDFFRSIVRNDSLKIEFALHDRWVASVWYIFLEQTGDFGANLKKILKHFFSQWPNIVQKLECYTSDRIQLLHDLEELVKASKLKAVGSDQIASDLRDFRLQTQYLNLQANTGIYIDEDAKSDGGKL